MRLPSLYIDDMLFQGLKQDEIEKVDTVSWSCESGRASIQGLLRVWAVSIRSLLLALLAGILHDDGTGCLEPKKPLANAETHHDNRPLLCKIQESSRPRNLQKTPVSPNHC